MNFSEYVFHLLIHGSNMQILKILKDIANKERLYYKFSKAQKHIRPQTQFTKRFARRFPISVLALYTAISLNSAMMAILQNLIQRMGQKDMIITSTLTITCIATPAAMCMTLRLTTLPLLTKLQVSSAVQKSTITVWYFADCAKNVTSKILNYLY